MKHLILGALALFLSAIPALATSAEEPFILKIERKSTVDASLSFARPEIKNLGMATIRTTPPWHDGKQVFEGVPLSRLMALLEPTGPSIEVVALNRYRTAIPLSDFKFHGPILALKRNGTYMPIRDKGPLFIVYPYGSKTELRTKQYFGRSAWQVATIVVN